MRWISLLVVIYLVSCSGGASTAPIKTDSVRQKVTPEIFLADSIKKDTSLLPDTIAAEKLIIPGSGIGRTTINEKASVVGGILGIPDKGDAAMGKAMSTWISKSNPRIATTIYFTTNFGDKDEASRVSQVRITSPFFITANGISVGASWKDIHRQFPMARLSGSYIDSLTKSKVRVMDDVQAGIAFEMDANEQCMGITIHKKADKAFETYISFFEGYEPVSQK